MNDLGLGVYAITRRACAAYVCVKRIFSKKLASDPELASVLANYTPLPPYRIAGYALRARGAG